MCLQTPFRALSARFSALTAADPRRIVVGMATGGGNVIELPESQIVGGTLGGLVAFRGESLDSAQNALGRVAIDVAAMNVDLMAISAHKMYGPKGIGALYVRRGRPRIRIEPLIHGGGHERGLRSGTLPVHQIVGLGAAAKYALEALTNGENDRIKALRDRLWEGLKTLDEVLLSQQVRSAGSFGLHQS